MNKPLDFVSTPKGGIAIITETNPPDNGMGRRHSIAYITNPGKEHNAWWSDDDLKYMTSLPALLTNNMAHPFGSNTGTGIVYFPEDKE